MASRKGPQPGRKVRNKAFKSVGMGGGETATDRAARLEAKEFEKTQKLIDAELADTQGIDDALEAYQDMRAQELDDIKYATKEADEVKGAQEFLQRRYKAMTDVGLPGAPEAGSAGKGYFSLAAHLDGLGELTADVPEAYHWQFGNGAKLRIGTEYSDVDPFTGQRSIVPSADPTDSKKALTMFEGTQSQARAIGKLGSDATGAGETAPKNATEYIQRQLMRRMGRQVESINSEAVTAPDFKDITPGKEKIVDGQIWNSSMPAKQSQLFTDVNTGSRMKDKVSQAREVRRRITDTIAKNPKASLGKVIGALSKTDDPNYKLYGGYDQTLRQRRTPDAGKIYDTTHHPKDSVFYADYTDEEAARLMRANHRANSFSDTEMLAPNEIREEDVKKVKNVFEKKRGSDIYDSMVIQGKYPDRASIEGVMNDAERAKTTTFTPQFKAETPEVGQFLRNVENGVEVIPSSGISTDPVGTPKAPPKSAAGLDVEDITPVKRRPTPPPIVRGGGQAGGDVTPLFIRNTLDVVGGMAKNPGVRLAGAAVGAIPILGDAADAATGTYDVITKTGRQQIRGAGNAAAGITGLTAVAAPATAPILAPVSAGLAVGGAASDWTMERRAKDKKYTRNTGSVDPFIHSDAAPVTISGPSVGPIVSETQRRRNARRSTPGTVKSRPGANAGAWWNKALNALGL